MIEQIVTKSTSTGNNHQLTLFAKLNLWTTHSVEQETHHEEISLSAQITPLFPKAICHSIGDKVHYIRLLSRCQRWTSRQVTSRYVKDLLMNKICQYISSILLKIDRQQYTKINWTLIGSFDFDSFFAFVESCRNWRTRI